MMTTPLRSSLIIVALLLAGVAGAQQESAFGPGEQSTYVVSYLGIRAGKAQITVGAPTQQWGENVIPLVAYAKTDSMGAVFPVQDKFVSWWDPATHRTVGSDLLANENKKKRRQRMRFDHTTRQAVITKQKDNDKPTEGVKEIPEGAMDIASATFALRNKDLAVGKSFELPVFTGAKSFTLKATVESTETMNTALGNREVFKVRVQTGFSGKFESKRDLFAWFTTDAAHLPVRIEAEFVLGSIVAQLDDYKEGMKLVAQPLAQDVGSGSP